MSFKTVLTAGAILIATIGANNAYAQQAPAAAPAAEPTYISAKLNRQQIDGLLTYADQILFVDVRRPDEISTIGGFPTYLSIQLQDLDKAAVFIPRDRTLITVSNHAGRALKAADALLAKGFKVAGAAGIQNYEAEGGKVTRIAVPAPKVAAAQ
jgi:rhodanese-related sulfurtransferase